MLDESEASLERIRHAKARLRARLLTARAARDRSTRARAAEGIAATARDSGLTAGLRCCAAYVDVRGEPGTRPLLRVLHDTGVQVLLPIVGADRRLLWGEYAGPAALTRGRFGLLEPTGPLPDTGAGPDPLTMAQLLIVPALAVDSHGVRLGRGAGYYDRLLARLPGHRVVAVVYDDELLEAVPAEPHDRPVHAVLTPTRLVTLPPQKTESRL